MSTLPILPHDPQPPLAGALPHARPALDALGPPHRVLYLSHTAEMGGAEIALLRLLATLDRQRIAPLVILAQDGVFADALREAGIEVHVEPLTAPVLQVRKDTLHLGGLLRRGALLPHLLRYAARLAHLARAHHVALIHTNSLKADLYGALAARLAGIPLVWHGHDRIDRAYLPTAAMHAFRFLARCLPRAVIVNSHSTGETLRLFPNERAPTRLRVIHIGLTDDELRVGAATAAARVFDTSRPVRIGMIGRFAPWKGQHLFLEAAARLQNEDATFFLVGAPLFGEKAYEQKLHALVEQLGLTGRVHFLGFRHDIPAVLQELDILVHASVVPEPFGNVVVEGMASGIAVIATDAGGVREIIAEGVNGYLVPCGDSAALAARLACLVADPFERARLGRAGSLCAATRFRASAAAAAVSELYDEILGRPAHRARTR